MPTQSADLAAVEASLTLAAERAGDPAPHVYATLFTRHPELEALFHMDVDGGVRGAMLQTGFECLLDEAAGGTMAGFIVAAERHHHDGYGVPEDLFDRFFEAIRDTIRDLVAPAWSAETEAAWARVLAALARHRLEG